jgi:hypothetical protein
MTSNGSGRPAPTTCSGRWTILKRCRSRGVGLEVAGVHDRVAQVFHLTVVDQALSLHPGLNGTLAILTAPRPAPEPVVPGAAPAVI